MEGLLLRLSALDADAENAVRVIGFFDRLVAGHASLGTVVLRATELAECPVGVGGQVPRNAITRELEDGTVVWLARDGEPLPLDEIVLERLAITAAVLLDHSRLPQPALGDPALVELALSDSAGELERSRALQLLGLTSTTRLRVLAVKNSEPATAVLVMSDEIPPQKGHVGVSPRVLAIEAPEAWRAARTAVRFATDITPVVHAESLGASMLLAQLPPADIAKVPDVIALDKLANELDMLNAVCTTSSIRQAATLIHRHHSTIAARLEHAQAILGFPLDTPDGRFRLRVALVLRQLRDHS
jgi:hypothetical protein